ncbi:MAG TPA: OmpA family protein [Cyclobacteriaceae bacterium]|nr:OmpA family protein [Cyclobacteriaceae bacterium]
MMPKLVGLILICSVSYFSQAQPLSTKNKKAIELYVQADNYRVRGQFNEAVTLLKEAITKDKKFEEAYYRLAITYKGMENQVQAAETFEQGLALVPEGARKKSYLYELADIYLKQGNYAKTQNFCKQFLQLEKADKRRIDKVTLWNEQATYSIANEGMLVDFKIEPLSEIVNQYPMQYFPVVTGDDSQLIFTARFGGSRNDNEDIVVSTKAADGSWLAPVSISDNINTIQREGACTISADGRHLIFTVCGTMGCDLYESRKTGNQWSVPKSMGPAINSSGWDAQPSLSADGRELYFVSERKGGMGGYDIWYSQLVETGWTKAINLGPSINTQFDEISPYIHVNNQNLYVVSNGYPGFGGYDIFRAERRADGWGQPVNLGKPLNDHKDQYSFIVSGNGAIAYYSKEESKNRSRLFKITLPDNLITKSRGNVVKGVVTNSTTKNPITAAVELFDLKENSMITKVKSDSVSGEYLMILPGGSEYALYVSRPGFLFQSLHFNYEEKTELKPVIKNISLSPAQQNAIVVLNNIFFDLNKYELKPQSITELKEVVDFMNKNPGLKIEIGGHTDDSGTEAYNQQLSAKRANAVAEFLKTNQIPTQRIVVKGYGSQKPVLPNTSEENRQQNRRIEFKIL